MCKAERMFNHGSKIRAMRRLWVALVLPLAIIGVVSVAKAAPSPVDSIRVCIGTKGKVSRLTSNKTCVGTRESWSATKAAPRLCWNNTSLNPADRTRVVYVASSRGCKSKTTEMTPGIRLLCADATSGILRWPVTGWCRAENIPTRVLVGRRVFAVQTTTTIPTTTTTTPTTSPGSSTTK